MFTNISWRQIKKSKNLTNIDLILITTLCHYHLDSMRKFKILPKKRKKKRKITGVINAPIMIFLG